MKRTPTSSTLIYPPWEAVNKYVVIPDEEHRIYSHVEFQTYMDDNYQQFHKIYTDRSTITDPNPSAASAIYIPHIKGIAYQKKNYFYYSHERKTF